MLTISIDQNSNSLWDVVPKLNALEARGYSVRHFVEDVDSAFTMPGAKVDDERLSIEREKFHHSGTAHWGAGLFYSEFFGRHAVDLRDLEPYLGMKISTLAKKLGQSVARLYERFSPGDNWQLVGSSYLGDKRHHRVIGDLKVSETASFVEEIFQKVCHDANRAFPDDDSRRRLDEWFQGELKFVRRLLKRHSEGRLADVYADWLGRHCGRSVRPDATSNLFATGADSPGTSMLAVFCKDYQTAAGLYNEALEQTGSKLRPLHAASGELPFFAVIVHNRRMMRTSMNLRGDAVIVADGRQGRFKLSPNGQPPMSEMKKAGIRCVAPKAIVLTIQVRLAPAGAPLALPYMGSLYMPASHALAGKLRNAGLLQGKLHPVVRVRFNLPERMKQARCNIRLPDYLAECFEGETVPAAELGEKFTQLQQQAQTQLEALRDDAARERWKRERFGRIYEKLDALDAAKRRQAKEDPKSPQIRQMWRQMKDLQNRLMRSVLEGVWREYQVSRIGYWDSRGALLPWCVGLGGMDFYKLLLREAEIYREGE